MNEPLIPELFQRRFLELFCQCLPTGRLRAGFLGDCERKEAERKAGIVITPKPKRKDCICYNGWLPPIEVTTSTRIRKLPYTERDIMNGGGGIRCPYCLEEDEKGNS